MSAQYRSWTTGWQSCKYPAVSWSLCVRDRLWTSFWLPYLNLQRPEWSPEYELGDVGSCFWAGRSSEATRPTRPSKVMFLTRFGQSSLGRKGNEWANDRRHASRRQFVSVIEKLTVNPREVPTGQDVRGVEITWSNLVAFYRTKPVEITSAQGLCRPLIHHILYQCHAKYWQLRIHPYQSTGAEMWKSNSRVHNFK